MFKKIRARLLWGGCFALILSFISVTISLAAGPQRQTESPEDCLECHEDSIMAWQESTHSQALSDVMFRQAWQEQGSPRECLRCHTTGYDAATGMWDAEGVTCAACHYLGPNSPSHPEQIMFTTDSADSCGACHLETYAEWLGSAHGENDMTCINCHNPHTNSLKKESMATLCQTCHTDEGYFYSMTTHAEEELMCTDCHLRVSDTPLGEGHGQRHHTFAVDLATCNACHGDQMHYPVESVGTDGLVVNNPASTDANLSLLTDTQMMELSTTPTSPYNFVMLAAVIGLAFGFVGSPLFERWFRRAS